MKREYTIAELDFKKSNGLIPVVVQEYSTTEVLTLAYVNETALRMSCESGFAHYYRRSKGRVMMKGVTSGNTQEIVKILVDCDADALVYLVRQKGPACHLDEGSCFHNVLQLEE